MWRTGRLRRQHNVAKPRNGRVVLARGGVFLVASQFLVEIGPAVVLALRPVMNGSLPTRPQALLVSYSDQHLEVFTSPGMDAHLVRIPWGIQPPMEWADEDVLLSLLPRRYQELYDARNLRLLGNTRPLTPEVQMDSEVIQRCIHTLNQLHQETTPGADEPMQWTL